MTTVLDPEMLDRALAAARPTVRGRLTELKGLHLLSRGVDAAQHIGAPERYSGAFGRAARPRLAV